ncbi:MAG: cytochrome c [Planctomycetota bacterium]
MAHVSARHTLAALGLLTGSIFGASAPQEAGTDNPQADPALVDLYVRKCASCHTVGRGPRVGPDLKGVDARRERTWIVDMIREPSRLLDRDPDARQLLQQYNGVRMPDLGLTAEQAAGLADLIALASKYPIDLTPAFVKVTEATTEDVARGRDLFFGRARTKSGGPACNACHTVEGAGGLIGGGTLAKELTHAFAVLGDEGLDAALANPAFPLMKEVFADHPLETDEVFALRAFLYDANRSAGAASDRLDIVVIGVLGTVVVILILNAAWARRLRGVRRTFVPKRGSQS